MKAPYLLTEQAITDFDLYLFGEGRHERIYEKLGAHPCAAGSEAGTLFAVWAPNAERLGAEEGSAGHSFSLRVNLPPLGALFLAGPTR